MQMTSESKVIGGGVLELERVQVICPACGQQVEAVAWDGRVKGYCAVAKQYVNFLVTQGTVADTRPKISGSFAGKRHTAEARIKMSAAHTGKHPPAETRAKISATLKGKRKLGMVMGTQSGLVAGPGY